MNYPWHWDLLRMNYPLGWYLPWRNYYSLNLLHFLLLQMRYIDAFCSSYYLCMLMRVYEARVHVRV